MNEGRVCYATVAVPLAEHLASVDGWPERERFVLCGELPPAPELRRYLTAVPAGWQVRVKQCRRNGRVEAYYTREDGRRVRVRSAAEWFGPAPLSPSEVYLLFSRLQWHLSHEFKRQTPAPLVCPQVCGMRLWLDMGGAEYEPLEPELQQLIRSTCGQGRRELLAPEELQELPSFWYWDMRLAYPAFLENLPVGPAQPLLLSQLAEEELPAKGWVRVRFRVPKGWAHVGLLPVKVPYLGHDWPTSGEHETWCDPSEARQARAQGWEVSLLEGYEYREGRPLNTWSRRLKRLYERFEEMGEDGLRHATRAILLHTVGDFHGRGRVAERAARTIRGTTVMRPYQPLTRESGAPSHPEWTAAVWCRCRYRLTRYLLAAPRESLVGCYLDAAYTIGNPGWGDPVWGQTTYGHMRLKGRLEGPLPVPTEERDLFNLSRQAAAALGEELPELPELLELGADE